MKRLILLIFSIALFAFNADAQRVLTQGEREGLINSHEFREKCEWAIRDYSSYWYEHDGASLNTDDRAKWRREYETVKDVRSANYSDSNLSLRFVILSKGMTFSVDSDPTTAEIIALFVSGNKFDELASKYFELVSK